MADPNDRPGAGAPPTEVHIEEKKGFNWLPWLLLALGLVALLFALSRCNRQSNAYVAPVDNAMTTDNTVVGETPGAPQSDALAGAGAGTGAGAAAGTAAGVSGLEPYLAGSEPVPRTFTFETLNFATAKSALTSADQAEIDRIAGVLKQHGATTIRIAGYADARGTDPANKKLGKARAEAVKAALVAKGIAGSRIETVSGGENDPVDTNATASGRAENRRTELVVTRR